MMDLLEPFEKMLADHVTPAAVRAVERGGDPAEMWAAFADSGFLDALVPETTGGSGLSLAEVAPLLMALGRYAVPLPVGETMLARALLAEAGIERPAGAIALVTGALPTPFARVAGHALVERQGRVNLLDLSGQSITQTGVFGDLSGIPALPETLSNPFIAAPPGGLRTIGALVRTSALAGASARLLDMAVAYANERVQFGKPIAKLQAIQQQLAVMAEHVVAARIAAELACAGGLPLNANAVAAAKIVVGQAAAQVATIAHAVFGAIGISEEHDVNLYTRRLHQSRLADGSESYWARALGAERLKSAQPSVDFVRTRFGQ